MKLIRVAVVSGLMILYVGCASTTRRSPDAVPGSDRPGGGADTALTLLMPSRIRIVEPFTRVRTPPSSSLPDRIELLLQAVNVLDDPGLMIVGRVRIELYEHLPATADPKGRKLEQWDIDLTTLNRQQAYWNPMTQMYEFLLGLDPVRIAPADKYVLAVTYESPLGDRLADQCVVAYKPAGAAPVRRP